MCADRLRSTGRRNRLRRAWASTRRALTVLLWLAPAALPGLASGQAAANAVAPEGSLRVVAPKKPLGAGEKVMLRVQNAAPGIQRLDWAVLNGPGFILPTGEYHAPYVIADSESLVTVGAFALIDSGRIRAEVALPLTPGEMAGAAACRGPEQERLPEYDETGAPDELPALVTRADAVIPRPKRGVAVRDTLPVNVLLCQDGHVIDAYVPPAYFEIEGRLVERDSTRLEAALAAARRYVFRPGKVQGKPVATWMTLFVPLKSR